MGEGDHDEKQKQKKEKKKNRVNGTSGYHDQHSQNTGVSGEVFPPPHLTALSWGKRVGTVAVCFLPTFRCCYLTLCHLTLPAVVVLFRDIPYVILFLLLPFPSPLFILFPFVIPSFYLSFLFHTSRLPFPSTFLFLFVFSLHFPSHFFSFLYFFFCFHFFTYIFFHQIVLFHLTL